MKKDTRLKALQELKEGFKVNDQMREWFYIRNLLTADFIPSDMDLYKVTIESQSKSLITGWSSHVETDEYYRFYVELVKNVDGEISSEWVKIEQDDADLLIKLHEILNS